MIKAKVKVINNLLIFVSVKLDLFSGCSDFLLCRFESLERMSEESGWSRIKKTFINSHILWHGFHQFLSFSLHCWCCLPSIFSSGGCLMWWCVPAAAVTLYSQRHNLLFGANSSMVFITLNLFCFSLRCCWCCCRCFC